MLLTCISFGISLGIPPRILSLSPFRIRFGNSFRDSFSYFFFMDFPGIPLRIFLVFPYGTLSSIPHEIYLKIVSEISAGFFRRFLPRCLHYFFQDSFNDFSRNLWMCSQIFRDSLKDPSEFLLGTIPAVFYGFLLGFLQEFEPGLLLVFFQELFQNNRSGILSDISFCFRLIFLIGFLPGFFPESRFLQIFSGFLRQQFHVGRARDSGRMGILRQCKEPFFKMCSRTTLEKIFKGTLEKKKK